MSTRVTGAAAIAGAVVLACNGGLEPVPGCPGICGTVTFQGAEPDKTAGVVIVAYEKFPQSRDDLFNFQPPLPLRSLPRPFRGSKSYAVALPSGTYQWVVAVWQKEGELTPKSADTLLQEAGFYPDKTDPTQPGVVTVSGAGAEGIDFAIDFRNMRRVCDLFPPCPQ